MTMPAIGTQSISSRFPRGKRGLKLRDTEFKNGKPMSLPSREAWIEIQAALLKAPVVRRFSRGKRGLKYRRTADY